LQSWAIPRLISRADLHDYDRRTAWFGGYVQNDLVLEALGIAQQRSRTSGEDWGIRPMSKVLLIYRLGSLGDTVVALPCFNKIMEVFPDHRRIVLTNFPVSSKAAPIELILRAGGFIDGTIAYPIGTRSPRVLLSIIGKLRATGADTLVYIGGGRGLASLRRDLVFFRVAGIRRVIGAPRTPDLDGGIWNSGTQRLEHESSRLARCLAELGTIDIDDPQAWDLRLKPSEHAHAKAILGDIGQAPFIVVSTGGKLPTQDWGDANWTRLLPELSATLSAPLVFIGGADDIPRANLLAAHWRHQILNTCGQLSPREVAALLQQATLFIGHDSGPMHLAAANGVTCVGLFGCNNPPGKWFPYGTGHCAHYDPVNVERIPPTVVAKSVLEIWSKARP
jgi:heptosyltransferase-3